VCTPCISGKHHYVLHCSICTARVAQGSGAHRVVLALAQYKTGLPTGLCMGRKALMIIMRVFALFVHVWCLPST